MSHHADDPAGRTPPGGSQLTRRTLLAGSAAATAALAVPGSRWLGLRSAGSAAAAQPFKTRLPIPKEIRGDRIRLVAKPAEARILPGRPTRLWTYNGTYPGPTIRRPSGASTELSFEHGLGRSAGELTLHLHGGHSSEASDGQPGGPGKNDPNRAFCRIATPGGSSPDPDRFLVKPGARRTYGYDGQQDGGDEAPATQWYHDHRCGATSRNIWRGLAGMWIVEAPAGADEELGLPTGERDVPLVVSDRQFNSKNQLTDPFDSFVTPPNDNTTGNRVLVNGALKPYLSVRPGAYRFRVLNASLFRSYNLSLPGAALVQVGTDSGLLTAPQPRSELLIGPGERVEVVVDFRSSAGRSLVLRSIARADGNDTLGSDPYRGELLQFRVASAPPEPPLALAQELRPLPGWATELDPDREPDVTWRMGVGPRTWGFAIDRPGEDEGLVRPFDPGRSSYSAALGSTEVWRLSNPTASAHLMHLHHTDWYILRRESVRREGNPLRYRYETTSREPVNGLKETFFLDSGESIVVAGRLTDHRGRFIVHCHMLDHEDHGLMDQFEVV